MITSTKEINNPSWQARSKCKDYDPAIWFTKGKTKLAKAICNSCPVKQKCLNWILILEKNGSSTARTGIYAGLSANQRSKIPLCYYGQCSNPVKSRAKEFCSEEHKRLHKKKMKDARKGEITTGVYYKQGRTPTL